MDSLPLEILFTALGKRIRDIRRLKGLSQKTVVERCGIHKANYSKIEMGKRHSSLRTLFKIAIALEEPVSSFFDDNEFYEFLEQIKKD